MTSEIEQVFREKGDTLPKMLKYNYEKYSDSQVAMRHKQYGIWRPYTWKDYYLNVKYLALGLLSFGFEPGDKVCIIGDNAPRWYYAELATQANLGACVGLYSDLTPPEIKYIAENSDSSFAVVEDQEQVDKFLQIKDELPLFKKVIYWDYKGLVRHYDDPILIGYEQVLELGRKYEKEHPGLFEQNVAKGRADDVCALVYTSGTTTVPKGAMHTHRTLLINAEYGQHLDPWSEKDNAVSYMPPAWIPEQVFCASHLWVGNTLNFPEKPETQQQDIREVGPMMLLYGSRLWEGQASMIQARIADADAIKRLAFRLLMPIGYKMADLEFQKKKPNLFWKILYALANIALFRPIRDSLGMSKVRICTTGGTMLSPDAFRFYHALNLRLKSLYGSTESGSITGVKTDAIRLDALGPPNKGTEVRIGDSGEIISRQAGSFLGYYNDPHNTAEVLKDGWVYTGDGGFITEDGYLVFLDRVSNLVALASGDKLAPEYLESRLRFSPYIRDAWVLPGPDRAYASAIIIIDYETVGRWAEQRRVAYTTFTDLSQKPEVYELVKKDIERINQALPPGTRVKKYVNLHKEFDADEAELTRTRKLRRNFMEERYSELINAIYSDMTELPVEAQVKYRDGRTGTIKTTISIKSVEGTAQ